MQPLTIADKTFQSRLFTGTGKFSSNTLMEQALEASHSELVTVALKRVHMRDKEDDLLIHLQHPRISLLPNTSGVRTAKEAVFAAQMAREALETNWIKLEIHPDPRYLLPDPVETLLATEQLAKQGVGIIMISSELPELLAMCDNFVIIYDGHVQKVFNKEEITKEKYMAAATGVDRI